MYRTFAKICTVGKSVCVFQKRDYSVAAFFILSTRTRLFTMIVSKGAARKIILQNSQHRYM